jgi:hypothetical protein
VSHASLRRSQPSVTATLAPPELHGARAWRFEVGGSRRASRDVT